MTLQLMTVEIPVNSYAGRSKEKIDVAAKSIYFVSGSSKLLAKSNKSLDEVAEILEADQDLRPDDNTGKAESILLLSRQRAQSVYDYLAKKEVGRSKNRRVELKSHYD